MTTRPHDEFERLLERVHQAPVPDAAVCPDPEIVAAYVEQALSPEERAIFERHAAACSRCAEAIALVVTGEPTAESDARVGWAALWASWRWLVPVATAVLVVAVWRGLPQREVANTPVRERPTVAASDAGREEAGAPQPPLRQSEPAPGPAARATNQPAASRGERQRPAAKTMPQRKESAPLAPTAPEETAKLHRFEAPADAAQPQDDRGILPPVASSPAAPAPVPEADASAGTAEAVTVLPATVVEVRSAGGGTTYRVESTGHIQRSIDGGRTWTLEAAAAAPALRAGSAPSRDVCWLAGGGGTVMRRSADGVWHTVSLPEPVDITSISATGDRIAIVTAADGSRWSTADGGMRWVRGP